MGTGTIFRRKLALVITGVQDQGRAHGEQGSAIMETALSMLVLLTVLFGLLELSLAAYSFHFASNAAREGARYAMVRGSTAGGACATYNTTYCNASGTNISDYVKSLGLPGISTASTAMTVSSAWSAFTGGSTCPASPAPCNSPGNLVTVTVTYSFPLSIPGIPAATIPMTSTSAMIISQ
jgi:Flp pilus assembly protein TadG